MVRDKLTLFKFGHDDGTLSVPASMEMRQRVQTLIPPILGGQPPGAFGKEEQSAEQDKTGDTLNAPRDPEGSGSGDGHGTSV